MGAIASQITSLTIVYSADYSDADQRKHQSSASLAFVRGSHRGPVNSPHKWPLTRKMFPFDNVIMTEPFMAIIQCLLISVSTITPLLPPSFRKSHELSNVYSIISQISLFQHGSISLLSGKWPVNWLLYIVWIPIRYHWQTQKGNR